MTHRGVVAALVLAASLVLPAPVAAQTDRCEVVIGMSQVRNMYQGARAVGLDTSRVFLHWSPGLVLGSWADPGSVGWTAPRLETDRRVGTPPCDPTHASFGFDPATGPILTMEQALDAVVENIVAEYPTVASVDVWLLVGDENHDRCSLNGRWVRAADLHNSYFDRWQAYTYGGAAATVSLGPDLNVPCPSGWRDSKGHLSVSGGQIAGADWIASRG